MTQKLELQPNEEIILDVSIGGVSCAKGAYLNVSFLLSEDALWADAGYETGFVQFALIEQPRNLTADTAGTLSVTEDKDFLTIAGVDFIYRFNKLYGAFKSMVYGGKEWLAEHAAFGVWRAPTNNDRRIKMAWGSYYDKFRDNEGLNLSSMSCYGTKLKEFADGKVVFETKCNISARAKVPIVRFTVKYTVTADGAVLHEVDATVLEAAPFLPRFGAEYVLTSGVKK